MYWVNKFLSLGPPEEGRVFLSGLSVFFPAYNDAQSLPDLLSRTFAVLRSCVRDYEVIVVNDGSTDNTGEVLDGLVRLYAPYLRIVTHPQNRGYGAALRSAVRAVHAGPLSATRRRLVLQLDSRPFASMAGHPPSTTCPCVAARAG